MSWLAGLELGFSKESKCCRRRAGRGGVLDSRDAQRTPNTESVFPCAFGHKFFYHPSASVARESYTRPQHHGHVYYSNRFRRVPLKMYQRYAVMIVHKCAGKVALESFYYDSIPTIPIEYPFFRRVFSQVCERLISREE